jgi:hypothetical protein
MKKLFITMNEKIYIQIFTGARGGCGHFLGPAKL